MISGEQGRSARTCWATASITSAARSSSIGPTLQLHQCGLPKLMAFKLYQPFVMYRLVVAEDAEKVKSAKGMVERRRPQVWDVLAGVVKEHPVLLEPGPDPPPPGHPGLRAGAGRGEGHPGPPAGLHRLQRRLRR